MDDVRLAIKASGIAASTVVLEITESVLLPGDGVIVERLHALAALGVPWGAAATAVALKASLAWLPALALGGASLLLFRRAVRREHGPADAVPAS